MCIYPHGSHIFYNCMHVNSTFLGCATHYHCIPIYTIQHLQWFTQTIEYLGDQQSEANEKRVWSAGIVMALIAVMKRTRIQSVFNINAFQVMFTYLCLEKTQREYIVGLMENTLRSVI